MPNGDISLMRRLRYSTRPVKVRRQLSPDSGDEIGLSRWAVLHALPADCTPITNDTESVWECSVISVICQCCGGAYDLHFERKPNHASGRLYITPS
jgi:hypothetical protein